MLTRYLVIDLKTLQIHFMNEPAWQRTPLEIWDRVARFIPRYHLRTLLFVSSSHREIAQRHIFHSLDLFFGDDQMDNVNKGLDVFSRVKKDPVFAKKIKTLRIHWAYEEGDMLDLMLRKYSIFPHVQSTHGRMIKAYSGSLCLCFLR